MSQLLTPIKINRSFVWLFAVFLISRRLNLNRFIFFSIAALFRCKCFRFCCYYYWHLFTWISLLTCAAQLAVSLTSLTLSLPFFRDVLYPIQEIAFQVYYIVVGPFEQIQTFCDYRNPSVLLLNTVQFASIIFLWFWLLAKWVIRIQYAWAFFLCSLQIFNFLQLLLFFAVLNICKSKSFS